MEKAKKKLGVEEDTEIPAGELKKIVTASKKIIKKEGIILLDYRALQDVWREMCVH